MKKRKKNNKITNFELLCDDVLSEIFLYLEWDDIEKNITYTCKRFHKFIWGNNVVFMNRVWKLVGIQKSKKEKARLFQSLWKSSNSCTWCSLKSKCPEFDCDGDFCQQKYQNTAEGWTCICQYGGQCVKCDKKFCDDCINYDWLFYCINYCTCKNFICRGCIEGDDDDVFFICSVCIKQRKESCTE